MDKDIIQHYDRLAFKRDLYRQKNSYYYALLFKEYQYFIPKGKKVLEVGCSTGDLLYALSPSKGVGIDTSPATVKIARAKYPKLEFFCGRIDEFPGDEKFDYIVLSGLIGELDDIQQFFVCLKKFCHAHTRIIIEYYSVLWQYLLKFAEKADVKIPQRNQNWITHHDVCNFLALTGYQPIKIERSILFPKNIWGLSYLLNRFVAKLPVFNALTLNHFIIARPVFYEQQDYDVSVVVACRNEKGNIEQVVKRLPILGRSTEIIFVEGGSVDGTYEEVKRVIKAYPDKNIKLIKQTASGKGEAVRVGLANSKGDVLMILDADLTVAPEDLPKFYAAIKENRGEFINGCRLVYPMEKEAMRFLNLLANKFFGIFFSWLLAVPFKDTLCGTKVLFKSDYNQIAANRSYFGDFDPFGDFDLIFGAVKLNLKVIELPIRYKERTYGTTNIHRFRHGLLLLKMCIFAMRKIKFR